MCGEHSYLKMRMGKLSKMGSFEWMSSVNHSTNKTGLCILAIKSAKCKRNEQQTFDCKNGAKNGINFVQMIEVKKEKKKALSNSAAFSHMIMCVKSNHSNQLKSCFISLTVKDGNEE